MLHVHIQHIVTELTMPNEQRMRTHACVLILKVFKLVIVSL
jgi:hypothetical protein